MESNRNFKYEADYVVDKEWGHELILVNNDLYCYKELYFDKANNKTSIHFHKNKTETFFVKKGSFCIEIYDAASGVPENIITNVNKAVNKAPITIKPLVVHRIIALDDDSILCEVSTSSEDSDSYRIKIT